MLRRICLATAVGLIPGAVQAQQCAAPTACAPRCDVPCRPCQPTDVAAPADKAAPGNFLRGPATGQASGKSHSFGIRGPALHIPEVRIALPTIEFPSPVKFTRGAEMFFDQGRGPHSLAEVQDFGNIDHAAPADVVAPAEEIPAAPKCTPYCPPPCDPNYHATVQRLEATLARMESLEKELAVLRAAAAERSAPQQEVVPVQGNGAAKPAISAAARGSRPVSNKPSQFFQASYEEPASTPVAPPTRAVARPQTSTKMGLSTPKSTTATEPDGFGSWSKSTRK